MIASSIDSAVDPRAFGPVRGSITEPRFFHLATVDELALWSAPAVGQVGSAII